MSALLVALGGALNSELLLPDVDRLRSTGLDVRLVTWAPPSPELVASLGEVVVLSGASLTSVPQRDLSSERAAQEVLEHAEDSLSAGDMPGSERLEESLGTPGDTDDEARDAGAEQGPDDALPALPGAPRVKARGVARVGQVAGRMLLNPRPYAARVYVLAKRRTRPLRRRLRRKLRRGMRRRVRALRANLHQPKATAAFFQNDRVRRIAADADVLVAVDSASVLAVWTLARRRDDVLAVIGVDAAIARGKAEVDTGA
jgi:hypothetical protein